MPFRQRIEQLQQTMRDNALAGAVLFYSRDILYYTGTAQPSWLVVLPHDYCLFVRRGYEFACRESGLESDRIVRESNIAAICAQMFPGAGAGERVGIELDLLGVVQARALSRGLNQRELVDISVDILDQRAQKIAQEIVCIRKACAAVHAGHLALVSGARAGMSELELAAGIEHAQRLAGHEGTYFMRTPDFIMSRGPFASGPNLRRTSGVAYTITGTGLSSAVPAGPSRRIVERGDLMLADIPACVEGYHADQSRSYALGKFPDRAVDLSCRLKEVADHLIANMAPGMSSGDAFAIADARAAELGLAESFLCFDSQPKAHFVGHGVGLELNEPPLLMRNGKAILKTGMVLAVEMHLMEPGGLTVKLEDTVHLGPAGVEILTLSPRELTLVDGGDVRLGLRFG